MESAMRYEQREQQWREQIYQGDRLPEFTAKSLGTGLFLGIVLVASNLYMGLQTGFTEGYSILAAILAFALIRGLRGNLSVLENNIAQTTASAAASIGIMVSVVPALILMDFEVSGIQIFLFLVTVSLLGVLFAIPLRKQFIVADEVPFPSGTACAAAIQAMHASGENAIRKTRALGITGIVAGLITWFRDAVPAFIPGVVFFPGRLGGLGAGVAMNPLLFGAGFIIGPRIGLSLLIGAVGGWMILGPILVNAELVTSVGSWTRWCAISMMVVAGFTSLALKWRTLADAFRSMIGARYSDSSSLEFPFNLWAWGMAGGAILVAIVMAALFGIPIWMSLLAVPISYVFAVVAVRAYGETDVNPVGTMGHSTQMAYGLLAPGRLMTNLTVGGMTAAGAEQAADMMQDFKTGYLLGGTPRKQTYAQLIGSVVGAAVAVPVFFSLTRAYGLGSERLPAIGAETWRGMAELLVEGTGNLPPYTWLGILGGALVGVGLTLLAGSRHRSFALSPMGIGMGILLPPFYSISLFLGSIIRFGVDRKAPEWSARNAMAIGSGAIAGEALLGVVISVLAAIGFIAMA
jgi:uncharacterized oligopeptide transporter (OPT) family protein